MAIPVHKPFNPKSFAEQMSPEDIEQVFADLLTRIEGLDDRVALQDFAIIHAAWSRFGAPKKSRSWQHRQSVREALGQAKFNQAMGVAEPSDFAPHEVLKRSGGTQ